MTLTESFPSRSDATAHALRQQSAYPGARVIVSGSVGCFTVSTTLQLRSDHDNQKQVLPRRL